MKKIATVCLFVIASVSVQGQQFDINDSLQGWYLFSSNTLDSSGNGNDGTVNGATLTTDRFNNANSAYTFNGTSDDIELPVSFDYPERSVVAWFYATNITPTTGHIYNSDHIGITNGSTGLSVRILGVEQLRHEHSGAGGPNAPINENEWYMATITRSDSARCYIDDVYLGAIPSGTVNSVTGNNFAQFGKSRVNDRFFQGKIDDARIYNRAIDWCEVRFLYHGDSILPTISVNGFDLTSSSGTSYQWNLNDTAINGATSINHTAIQNGSYTVTVIDTAGCEYTSLPVIITGVGINEMVITNPFDIYPNPTTGIFTVQGPSLHGRVNAATEIQVYDLLGNLVLHTNKRQVDMGSYPAGIYMVKAGQAVRKLVKQ